MAFYSKDIDLYAKDAMLNYIRSQQTEFEVVQGKISALISESELEELEDGHTTMYSRLADVELRADGFDAEFSEMDTKYNSVTGEITAMDSRLSTFSAGLNGLDSRITQTNTNLQNNYWTSTQTATEIQQSANSIMLQVSSGYATKSESVSAVVVEYAVGASSTSAPTSGWSSNSPTWTSGKYIWQRTAITKNGNTTYSNVTCIQGAQGESGTSVTVSSIKYQQGDSPTTAPTGTWSNSPVTVDQGKYLWTKTTYSNSSVAYTVSRQGVDGAKGLNVATVYLYQRSASAPSKPSSDLTYTFSTGKLSGTLGSWSQTIPSGTNPCYVIIATASATTATDTIPSSEWTVPVQLVVNGTNGTNGVDGYNQATVFLYQRKSSVPSKPASAVTFNFSTGKLTSLPAGWTQSIPTANGNPCYVTTASAISQTSTAQILASAWSDVSKLAEDGQDGAQGDDGVGISTVKAQYYLSSSKTAQSGGSWSDTPPEWVQGKYLWTRSHITYTDNTTSTTTPVLDQVNTDLEERMASAELKITAEAIVSTVTNSEDMGSYVEQKADGIRLKAEKLVWQANNSSLDEYGNLTVTAGGSINAGSIYGGTLSLGGGTHGYSNMYMYDRNGNEIGSWTYLDGLEVKKGEITLEKYNSSDGSLEITSFSQGRIGYTYHADATDQSHPQFAGFALSSQTTSGGVVTHPVYIRAMDGSKIIAQVVGNSASASSVELVPYGKKDSYNGDNRFAVTGKAYFYSDLKVLGTKSRVAKTDDYGDRLFYCYETATPMFGDIGEGTIGEDGLCYIPLDPMFAQTVSCDQYQVFLQKYTDGTAYVSQREKSWFVVSGDPGVSFGWEVKAKQLGYEMMRMNNPEDYTDVVLSEYGRVGAEHIEQVNDERSITL